jgi:hypothetical protein
MSPFALEWAMLLRRSVRCEVWRTYVLIPDGPAAALR